MRVSRSADIPTSAGDTSVRGVVTKVWNDLTTRLRLTDPSEYQAASSRSARAYVNGLLTLMWEKSLDTIAITPDRPVPDLTNVTSSPNDDQLFDQMELTMDEVGADEVISILKELGGLRRYSWFKKRAVFACKLAQSDELIDVSFEIQETRDDQRRKCLLISRARA